MWRGKGTKPQSCVNSYTGVYKILWIKFRFKKQRKDTNLVLEK